MTNTDSIRVEHPTPNRDEAVAAAARVFVQMEAVAAQMTPRQLAEASWTPTSPCTVDELEDEIRADRGVPAIDRGADT